MRTDKELLDDIRNAFRKAGWSEDMLGEFYLLGTVEETLYRYNRMETTLIGFVELVKCIQTNTMKANASLDRPAASAGTVGGVVGHFEAKGGGQ